MFTSPFGFALSEVSVDRFGEAETITSVAARPTTAVPSTSVQLSPELVTLLMTDWPRSVVRSEA